MSEKESLIFEQSVYNVAIIEWEQMEEDNEKRY